MASEGHTPPDQHQSLNCLYRCYQKDGLGDLPQFLHPAGEDSLKVTLRFIRGTLCFRQTGGRLSLE
jgi:hypothetical protein